MSDKNKMHAERYSKQFYFSVDTENNDSNYIQHKKDVIVMGCLQRIANTMDAILKKWENYELEQTKSTKIIKNLRARNKALRNKLKGK